MELNNNYNEIENLKWVRLAFYYMKNLHLFHSLSLKADGDLLQ